MFNGFHAFSDDAEAERCAQRDNGAGNGSIIRIIQGIADKALVNF